MSIERNRLKKQLLDKGISWTDEEIDGFLEDQKVNERQIKKQTTSQPMGLAPISPRKYLPQSGTGLRRRGLGQAPMPRGLRGTEPGNPQRNWLWDMAGNFAWEALDTTSLGILGWADQDDELEDWFTGGGPQGTAGMIGAGLGGLAGFLAPMGAAKGIASKGIGAISKYGTGRVGSKMMKEATESVAAKKGSKALKDYKQFSSLPKHKQKEIFEPYMQSFKKDAHKFHNLKEKEAWIGTFEKTSRNVLETELARKGIKITNEAVLNNVHNIAKNSLLNAAGKKVLPSTTLQESLQLYFASTGARLGMGPGGAGGKFASAMSHIAEEAVLFAAVETPMAVFATAEETGDFGWESFKHGLTETEYGSTLGHAVSLGSALGLIRVGLPGGKDQGILKGFYERTVGKGTFKSMATGVEGGFGGLLTKKRSYNKFDPKIEADREELIKTAENIFRNSGDGRIFTGKGVRNAEGLDITRLSQIREVVYGAGKQSEAEMISGANKLKNFLTSVERDWNKYWWPQFRKEAVQDLKESTPRMLAGAMAFNYDTIFDDQIPMESKVFNVALGAFMTKKGRNLQYTNKDGKLANWAKTERPYTYDPNFKRAHEYLNLLGMRDGPMRSSIFNGMVNDYHMREKFLKVDESSDVKRLKEIINQVTVPRDTPVKTRKNIKNPGRRGFHPVYEHLNLLADHAMLGDSKRMLDVTEMPTSKVKRIESILKNSNFESTKSGRVQEIYDLDDIIYEANRPKIYEVWALHKDYVQEVYRELGGEVITDPKRPMPVNIWQKSHTFKEGSVTPRAEEAIQMFGRSVEALTRAPEDFQIYKIRNPKTALHYDHTKLDKIADISARYENKLNKIIYDKTGPSDSQNLVPLANDPLMKLMMGQGRRHTIRDLYDKFNDFENVSGVWKSNKRTKSESDNDGKAIYEKITEIFAEDNGILPINIELSDLKSADSKSLEVFAKRLHKILPQIPQFSQPWQFKGMELPTKTLDANALRELRTLMRENGLNVFLKPERNDLEVSTWIEDFNSYSRSRNLARKTVLDSKGNKRPLNSTEMTQVLEVIQRGVADSDFKIVDLRNVMGRVEALMPRAEQLISDMKLQGKGINVADIEGAFATQNARFFVENLKLKPESAEVMNMIGRAAELGGYEPIQFGKTLLNKWQTIINPLMVDGKGNGIFNFGLEKKVGQVDHGYLLDLVTSLESIGLRAEATTHKQFIDKVEMLRANSELSPAESNFLKHLNQRYATEPKEARTIIGLLSKLGLYKPNKNEFNIEGPDKIKAMELAMRTSDYILPTSLSSSKVEQRISELKDRNTKEYEVDIFESITPQEYTKKYNLDKDYFLNPDFLIKSKKHESLFNDIAVKEGKDFISYKDLKDKKLKDKVRNETYAVIKNLTTSKRVPRATFMEGSGMYLDNDYVVAKNYLTDSADLYLGKSDWIIFDTMVSTRNGWLDTRSDFNGWKKYLRDTASGKTIFTDKMLKENMGDIKWDRMGPYTPIRFGDMEMQIGIPDAKLPALGKQLADRLKKNKTTYGEKYKDVNDKIQQVVERHMRERKTGEKDAKGKDIIDWEYLNTTSEGKYEFAQVAFNHLTFDKQFGRVWWDHLSKTINGSNPFEFAKFARRLRLIGNNSARRMSQPLLDAAIGIHEGGLNTKGLKGLKRIKKNDGLGIVIPKDEAFKSSIMTSLWDQVAKDLAEASKNSKEFEKFKDLVRKNDEGEWEFVSKFKDLDGNDRLIGDASTVDGATLVRKEIFEALSMLAGSGHIEGLGGIKPIVHRMADGNGHGVMLGKTAFIYNKAFDSFFANKSNSKVDMIMFDSANKIFDTNVIKVTPEATTTFDSFVSMGLNKQINKVKISDISIGSVGNADHHATISFQSQIGFGRAESKEMYNWLLGDKVDSYRNDASTFFNQANPDMAISQAKYYLNKNNNSNPQGRFERWIESSGNPFLLEFMPDYKNLMKTNLIDNNGMMTMVNKMGTQSVLSPATEFTTLEGQKLVSSKLRNSIFWSPNDGAREIWQYGEASLAHVNKSKAVDINNLNIIGHNKTSKDDLLTFKEFLKETKQKKDSFKDLEDAVKFVNATAGDYQVAVVFHRTPRQKPGGGDMVIVGIKDFLSITEGNQARINSFDLKMRMEGDFDIDKANYWWNTPEKILKKWDKDSGFTEASFVDAVNTRTTLTRDSAKQYDWFNPLSIAQYNHDTAVASKLRGRMVKMQRMIDYVTSYNAWDNMRNTDGSAYKGFSVSLGDKVGGQIRINPENLKKSLRILSDDIQNILDSTVGYNHRRYNESWNDNFLFGDGGRYPGIFEKWQYNADSKAWEGTGLNVKDNTHRAIINAVLSPYRSMLQLGSGLYDQGKKQSVKYDDLINGAKEYSSYMENLSNRVYYKVRRQPGIQRDNLDLIFKDKSGKMRNPFGDFGTSANFKGNRPENLLPFDRVVQGLFNSDRFTVDMPNKMFGSDMEIFQKNFDNYVNNDFKTEVLSNIVSSYKTNNRLFGKLNWLDWKIKELTNSMYNAKRDRQTGLSEFYENAKRDHERMRDDLNEALTMDPKVVGKLRATSISNYTKEIINNPFTNSIKQFKGDKSKGLTAKEEAKAWVYSKEGRNFIRSYVSNKGPVRIKGLRTDVQLNEIMWNEALGKWNNVFIHPEAQSAVTGHLSKTFEGDLANFEGKIYRENWSNFFNDKKRQGRGAAHLNENQLYSVIKLRLDEYFDKWETNHDGLGKLFLWKLMAPKLDPMSVTYIPTGKKGILLESFQGNRTGLRKLVLNYLSETHRIGELEKKAIFDDLSTTMNSNWNIFHGLEMNPLSTEVSKFEAIVKNNKMNTLAGYYPFEDFNITYKVGREAESIQHKEIDRDVASLFGYGNNFTTGYILNNRTVSPEFIGQYMKASEWDFMPQGWLAEDFSGGLHQSITGWNTWNEAKRSKAKLYLGDALGKNVLWVDNKIGTNAPFERTGTKAETMYDLMNQNESKVRSENCK